MVVEITTMNDAMRVQQTKNTCRINTLGIGTLDALFMSTAASSGRAGSYSFTHDATGLTDQNRVI